MLALPILGACGKDPATQPGATAAALRNADRAAIENLIQTSPDFDVAFADDGGELLGEAPSATASTLGAETAPSGATDTTATPPIHWGRMRIPPGHPPRRTIEFLIPPGEGRALVKITVRYHGWFFVDRTDDGVRNPGKKPLLDQKTRYALFRKIWFHEESSPEDSVFGWRLVALSPSEFTMIDPARQTVAIGSVTLTGERTHVTITDPSALLSFGRTDELLPLFRSGEEVKVEARVSNTDTGFDPATFVFLHVPIVDGAFLSPWQRARIRMRDDGMRGDAAAGDGIFTAMWSVSNTGRHHIGVDVLNSRTLQNETDDDYNSTTWGIPYRSYPAFLP